MRTAVLVACAVMVLVMMGCDSAEPEPVLATDCSTVSAPPDSLGLHSFYDKYCPAAGIPVVSAGSVPDEAVKQAGRIVDTMLTHLPEVETQLARSELRVGVIGEDQETTDMPEYRDLDEEYPDVDWDERTRGLGATEARPLTSAGEENILCYADDRYAGENILVHEFSHTIKGMGIEEVDGSFAERIEEIYDRAMEADRWNDTYAATNPDEYWAEGVQSYFNTNLEASPPDGVHNHVDTRSELEEYDPSLFAVVDSSFGGLDWGPTCP